MVSKGQFVDLQKVSGKSIRLDQRGLWVQIPSGTRIFSEFCLHLISCCCCFILNILTLEVGCLHLDMP